MTPVKSPPSPVRPNIVVFLVDDMGWQDTSVPFWTEVTPFNHRYRTPSMERMAREGVKFTQAYACPVCSPSRVSLLTGLNAARHRVTNWTFRKDIAQDAPLSGLRFPEWNVNGITPRPGIGRAVHAICLPELLRQAGYRTIHVGKAHFGAIGTPGADPLNLGFDVNIGGHAAGGPGSYLSEQGFSAAWRGGDRAWDVPGLDAYHNSGIFLTEALTREAIKQVDRAVVDRVPFFLYLSHYAVHVPFAEDPRFIGNYRDLSPEEAMYAALIEGMDRSLGDLLDCLDSRRLADNTVVLFMSDNGGLSAHGRGGVPHTHNTPLSSGKGSMHEGGIREPMLVRWPGVVAPGTTCDTPVIIEDFFPTLLDVAGVPALRRSGAGHDGLSFVPLLRGQPARAGDRSFVWHYPNNWGPTGPGIGPASAIRHGEWKYIFYHDPARPVRQELFHVIDDIGETRNRINDTPAQARQLSAELRDYLVGVQAQMPLDERTGHIVEVPGTSRSDQP